MSPIVHGMIAWVFAIMLMKDVHDRRLVVIMGVCLDIDGIFILFNYDLFYEYHHTFTHSYVFGIMIAIVAGILGKEKIKVAIAGLGAFTLHIIADIIGSNWPIKYIYPFSDDSISLVAYLSDFVIYGIINPITLLLLCVGIILIAYKKEKSPFEFISGKLDEKIVGLFIYPFKYKCNICGKRSNFKCIKCSSYFCFKHGHSSSFKTLCDKCK